MAKINTDEMVRKVGTGCITWLRKNYRIDFIDRNCIGERLSLSLPAFRSYLDGLLFYLTKNIDSDSEQLLGSYVVSSKEGKNYVTIKKSKSRLPRSVRGYINWVDWDITLQEGGVATRYTRVTRFILQPYHTAYTLPHNVAPRQGLSTYFKCGLSQALLQSLFGLGQTVDLKSKPLPTEDLRCRVGNYILLYDHLAKEWRIWKKT
jgi:hypothetical protein